MNYPAIDYVPAYPDVHTYANLFGRMLTWEGDPWIEADLARFESSYIHAGISGFEHTFKGPDAQKLLSDASINNVYKWKPGRCKHLVMLDEGGLVASHALFMRDDEETFRITAGVEFPLVKLMQTGKYNVEMTTRDIFVFQFSGPKSLTILEKATQQDLRDVKFLDFRPVTIPGVDAGIEICRIGMSGTLAYELRGAKADGPAVYDAVYQVGKPLGLKRLGWRGYHVNHTFGGFPQINCSFAMSIFRDPEFMKVALEQLATSGSVEPENLRARFRTPGETGWTWMAKLDHDFVGRAALEAEMAAPKRTVASLLWNTEDIMDIYASQFREGEPYKYMEMPSGVQQPAGGHADYVTTLDGKVIGYASDPAYCAYYRQTLSECAIDVDQAQVGNEVIIRWGDYGKKIKNVRAKVVRYPYIDLVKNEDYDLSTVPSGLD